MVQKFPTKKQKKESKNIPGSWVQLSLSYLPFRFACEVSAEGNYTQKQYPCHSNVSAYLTCGVDEDVDDCLVRIHGYFGSDAYSQNDGLAK